MKDSHRLKFPLRASMDDSSVATLIVTFNQFWLEVERGRISTSNIAEFVRRIGFYRPYTLISNCR